MTAKNTRELPLKLSTSNRKILSTVKKKLREKVPQISTNELRRIRMRFHEALLLELRESQDFEAYQFFNEIIQRDLEESMDIVNDNDLAELIFNELKKTVLTKEEKIENLLKLSQMIQDLDIPIKWLIETIYSEVLTLIQTFLFSGTRVEAYAKFCYGKLLKSVKSFEKAVKFLEESLKVCTSENEWLVPGKTSKKQEKLNDLVADELHQSMIELSKFIRLSDPEKSLELVNKSLKLFRIFQIHKKIEKEVNCEMELGNCYEALKDFEKARQHFQHAFEMSAMSDSHQVGLNALFKTAKCYKNMQKFDKCDETLNRALMDAKSDVKTAVFEGDILIKIGKFWMERNDVEKALENFNKALRVFEKASDIEKLHELHILMAFPLGKFELSVF